MIMLCHWSQADCQSLWRHRFHATSGIHASMCSLVRFLHLDWSGPFEFSALGHIVDFSLPSSTLQVAAQRGLGAAKRNRDFLQLYHELRVFLRRVAASRTSDDRQFNYGGLGAGLSESIPIRASTHAMRTHECGAALFSCSVWTELKSCLSYKSVSDICPRCNLHRETLWHRLWRCPANAPALASLAEHLGIQHVDPSIWPSCLSHCGLVPADLSITAEHAHAIQSYLVSVNRHATRALAASWTDTPFQMECAFNWLDTSNVRNVSLPPVPKFRPRNTAPAVRFTDPPPPLPVDTGGINKSTAYVDGSYKPPRRDTDLPTCGFGVSVFSPAHDHTLDACAPVSLDPDSQIFYGATVLSNNIAELSAIIHVLLWCSNTASPVPELCIMYDSEYAAAMTQRLWRARRHFTLVNHARRLLDRVRDRGTIVSFAHIDSHTGNLGNDRADALADLGAAGYQRLLPHLAS